MTSLVVSIVVCFYLGWEYIVTLADPKGYTYTEGCSDFV